jgi:hypothetical protein
MRITFHALVTAVAATICAGSAYAQLQQPASARPASLTYTYYAQDDADPAQLSPSDIAVPEDDEAVADEPAASDVAAVEDCEEDDGPVHLFNPTCHGIQVGGWINGGVYYNQYGNDQTFGNAPIPFVQHADSPMLNQAWIYADKPLDLENNCTDWGFHIDYMFGADGPDTQAFGDEGWDNLWDAGRYYGSAIPQLYVEYGHCDWSVKAGHFYTLIGYEVVQAPLNFFYSHAYVMNYGEPFTHTGALVTKQVNDQVKVTGGYVMGWDSGFNNSNDAHEFLGSISWTSCDERLNVIYAVNFGDWGDGTRLDDVALVINQPRGIPGNNGKIYDHSLVAIYDVNECVQYVFQSDYAVNWDLPGGQQTTWYGVNQYLFYTLSNCCKLGGRFEWFDDNDGARVGTGKNDFYAITLGLNYTPNSNVCVRPEIRYDWASDNPAFDPNAARQPTKDDGLFYGVDFYVLF